MELRHLRYFVAVAEEQKISSAALKLHISQPALSRQVRDLEDEIGFRLFERSAKSIKLTHAGRIFLIEARGVLQSATEAVNKTRKALNLQNGELNIGYAPSLPLQIIPRALRKFQEKFPNTRVTLHDLSTGEMLSQLREEKLQLAITVQLPVRFLHGLKTAQLTRHPISIAVAPKHPLAKSKSVTLERLALEPLMLLSPKDYPESEEVFERVFAQVRPKPHIVSEYDSITSLIAEVQAGRGFAFVPSSKFPKEYIWSAPEIHSAHSSIICLGCGDLAQRIGNRRSEIFHHIGKTESRISAKNLINHSNVR